MVDAWHKLCDDAITEVDRDWEIYGKAYRNYYNNKNYNIPWIRGFDHVLDYLVQNPPISRRARKRMEKAQRKKEKRK
jgi:hypothetical protein